MALIEDFFKDTMRDIDKTKDELIRELVELRRKNTELESIKPSEESSKTENALQLNEEHFRAIVENQVQFVDRYLPGGILTYVNSALVRYVGVSPENLIGKSFFPFVHKDDLQELIRELEALTPEKPFVKMESRVILPDGSVRWHRWVHQAFFDESGKVREYQSVGEDITDQRKAEESLRQSEKKFRTLAENFPDIIARLDKQFRHLYVSPSIEKCTGLSAENFLGKTNEELGMPAENLYIWNNRLHKVFETGTPEEFTFEFSKNRQSYIFSSLLVPEFSQNGVIESVMAITRDITKLKRAEERLMLYSKELEETNSALKVLLKQREEERRESEERFLATVRKLILPYVELLRKKIGIMPEANTYINVIERNIDEIISSSSAGFALKLGALTHAESLVANLVKEGKQDKEIAQTLELSIHTVKAHRRNIRKKLSLTGKSGNLKSFLSS